MSLIVNEKAFGGLIPVDTMFGILPVFVHSLLYGVAYDDTTVRCLSCIYV